MEPLFLHYYNQELLFMREEAKRFAEQHPKIAKRLGLQGIEVQDPYVERLLEGFAFMSARIQLKLSAEFPRFTKRLLDVIYPHFNCPTPAMGVVKICPTPSKGDVSLGIPVPKGTLLSARPHLQEVSTCHFSTGFDTTLWPIQVVKAQITGIPPELLNLQRQLPAHTRVESALRITLRSMSDVLPLSDMKGLSALPFYLQGDEGVVSKLYELIHTCTVGYTVQQTSWQTDNHPVMMDGVSPLGLELDQSILPQIREAMHGHYLLHSYFTHPDIFYFFTLNGIDRWIETVTDQEVEIVLLLSRYDKDLADVVHKDHFVTNCVSIINLYPSMCDNVALDPKHVEQHIQVSRHEPMDYEIYSLLSVKAESLNVSTDQVGNTQEFRPLYRTVNADQGNYAAYYVIDRELRVVSENARMYGTRTHYVGTEVFLSLVDQEENVYFPEHRTLSIRALVTNRDLPLLLVRRADGDLTSNSTLPIDSIHILRTLSAPRLPLAQGEPAWKLIQLLGFNFHPLLELTPEESSQAIRDLLALFTYEDAHAFHKQIDALIGVDFTPVTRRIPQVGPLVYARGTKVMLTINEEGFSGGSPYLFAAILERWLAKHISLNSFLQVELRTVQRGVVHTWPIRMGARSSI